MSDFRCENIVNHEIPGRHHRKHMYQNIYTISSAHQIGTHTERFVRVTQVFSLPTDYLVFGDIMMCYDCVPKFYTVYGVDKSNSI